MKILSVLILCLFGISLVAASPFGYDNPSLPKLLPLELQSAYTEYQPLENQRLSTTNNVEFQNITLARLQMSSQVLTATASGAIFSPGYLYASGNTGGYSFYALKKASFRGNITSDTQACVGFEKPIQIFKNLTATACAAATEGAVYYDGGTKKHYGCDGTNWNALY